MQSFFLAGLFKERRTPTTPDRRRIGARRIARGGKRGGASATAEEREPRSEGKRRRCADNGKRGRRTSSGATEKGAPFFASEPVGGALAHSDECERREGRKAREIARRLGKGAQAGREERSPLANEERPNDSTDTN